jgi:hypothetical protein
MSQKDSSNFDDDDEMAAVHWEFDTDREDPGVDVAEVIAELEGKESTDLSPVYTTIDHMVEELFSEPPSPEAQAVLQFSYEGYRITLNQDGYATFMKITEGE